MSKFNALRAQLATVTTPITPVVVDETLKNRALKALTAFEAAEAKKEEGAFTGSQMKVAKVEEAKAENAAKAVKALAEAFAALKQADREVKKFQDAIKGGVGRNKAQAALPTALETQAKAKEAYKTAQQVEAKAKEGAAPLMVEKALARRFTPRKGGFSCRFGATLEGVPMGRLSRKARISKKAGRKARTASRFTIDQVMEMEAKRLKAQQAELAAKAEKAEMEKGAQACLERLKKGKKAAISAAAHYLKGDPTPFCVGYLKEAERLGLI